MKTLALLLLLLTGMTTHAQTWDEWFRQKKTQKKYLIEQIVALTVYLDYAKKGYRIVDKGLETIGDIRDGEFGLHQVFLDRKESINPIVKGYSAVGYTIELQLKISREREHGYRALEQSGQFSAAELQTIREVHFRMLEESQNDLDQLLLVLTPEEFTMSDAERLERIDTIHHSMQERYQSLKGYNGRMKELATRRARIKADGRLLKIINKQHP